MRSTRLSAFSFLFQTAGRMGLSGTHPWLELGRRNPVWRTCGYCQGWAMGTLQRSPPSPDRGLPRPPLAPKQLGLWGPITSSLPPPPPLVLAPSLLRRHPRVGGKVLGPSSITSPWLAVPRERSHHLHGHVAQLPAMPGNNDRLSVLRLVRSCMQMTRL